MFIYDHIKVQTQEKLLLALNKELKETKQAKALVEQEFQMYRNQSQVRVHYKVFLAVMRL